MLRASQHPLVQRLLLASLVLSPLAQATPDLKSAAANRLAEAQPVVRYGRYRLVDLGPAPRAWDLMGQVVDVTLPSLSHDPTVGDALHYVLQHSGYQLAPTVEARVLFSRPLPAAHDHLGPMTLRDALLILAGPAWELHTNEVARQVWFTRAGPPGAATPLPTIPKMSTKPPAVATRGEEP